MLPKLKHKWPRFLIAWGNNGTPRKIWYVAISALIIISLGMGIGYWRTSHSPVQNASTQDANAGTGEKDPSAQVQGSTPANGETTAQSQSQENSAAPKLVTYTVKEGDTLTSIAQAFSTSVESIISINGFTSPDRLSVGQKITVMQNAKGTVKRVEEGDTLWDIARTYNISVEEIVKANSLQNADDIHPGQLLMLPGAKPMMPGPLIASSSRSSVFSWPCSGPITSGFGWRIHPITGQREFHEGLDIGASYGSPVKAAGSGTVTFTGWMSGYGKIIIISHGNNVETRYAHLSSIKVSNGQRVSAGEVIGYVGQTGDATGPHLHFEVRVKGVAQDPRKYLP